MQRQIVFDICMQVDLERVVVTIGFVFGEADGAEALEWDHLVIVAGIVEKTGQKSSVRKVDLTEVALIPALVTHLRHRQYTLRSQGPLYTDVVLIAGGQFVLLAIETRDVGDDDRQGRRNDGGTALNAGLWVRRHY